MFANTLRPDSKYLGLARAFKQLNYNWYQVSLMGLKKRIELIKKIEKIRDSRVITYVISDRDNINTMIEEKDLREFYDHLKNVRKKQRIDLFIYSLGGDATVAWTLCNLLRETSIDINVLVPTKAFSCATAIAIGVNNIIMHRMGCLGPVDPLVANVYNPRIQGRIVPISVEDVAGFLSFIKENFGIKNSKNSIKLANEDNVLKTFESLCHNVHPLALGNVYRHYMKSRDDTKKLLELNFDPVKDKKKIEEIIEILVEKLYYHGHHINRNEGKKIGLKIKFADKYSDKTHNLADVMWELFIEYEKDLSLKTPYSDELPKRGTQNEIPIKFMESRKLSNKMIIEQNFIDMGFPRGTVICAIKGQTGVLIPNNPNPVLVHFQGEPVFLNNKVYDKREISYWKQEKI